MLCVRLEIRGGKTLSIPSRRAPQTSSRQWGADLALDWGKSPPPNPPLGAKGADYAVEWGGGNPPPNPPPGAKGADYALEWGENLPKPPSWR